MIYTTQDAWKFTAKVGKFYPGDFLWMSVRPLFRQLYLPFPRRGEYWHGDGGDLAFLTPVGCTARVRPFLAGHPQEQSKNAIKPLGMIRNADVMVEIFPGGQVRTSEAAWRDMQRLKKYIALEGFDFRDRKTVNICYLPVQTPQWPDGVPLVVDPGAIGGINKPVSRLFGKLLQSCGYPIFPVDRQGVEIQDKFYEPLRQAFARATDPANKVSAPVRMKEFWNQCAAARKAGTLVADWKNNPWTLDLEVITSTYDQRLRRHPIFKPLYEPSVG